MTSWRQEYLLALQARDRIEQAQKPLYDAYTRLADRAATADAQARAISEAEPTSIQPSKAAPPKTPAQPPSNAESLAQIRADLTEAQRNRDSLQSRLKDISSSLQKSKSQSAIDKKRLDELASERATLTLRLRDQDEELRGKTKLLEDLHDEKVSMTLELNMAEHQVQRLRKENEELVERWMARMGEEANAMNEASKFA
ncbi:MAG: hypothetical protein Q9223_000662 [Gallowayella weberi]